MTFANQTVLITGGNSGLGESVALRLAAENARVWIAARDPVSTKKVVEKIKERGGVGNCFLCDITSSSEVKNCVSHIIQQEAKVDVLINNAGVWIQGDIENSDPDDIQRIFEVNAIGTIYMTQAVLPTMKSHNRGHIVNVISTAAVGASQYWPIYTATKHSVRGFTQSLKLDVEGTNIKVTGLYPGGIGTQLYEAAGLDYSTDEPWMMDRDDIADIVRFLLAQPPDVVIDHIEVRKTGYYS